MAIDYSQHTSLGFRLPSKHLARKVQKNDSGIHWPLSHLTISGGHSWCSAHVHSAHSRPHGWVWHTNYRYSHEISTLPYFSEVARARTSNCHRSAFTMTSVSIS